MGDHELLDREYRPERSFRPGRYRDANWDKALKLLIMGNTRWRNVSRRELIEIVSIDDALRPQMLRDIARELRHRWDDLDQHAAQRRDSQLLSRSLPAAG